MVAMTPMNDNGKSKPSQPPKGPGVRVLDLFSNVWFGIFWAVMLFFYCSIGSAIPHIRQLPSLEMTEFEWFHWWPFNVLILLFCSCLITTTLRRIPLRTVNYGVWMIHTGLIVLCAGSFYYFSLKVEGDAPVFRRQVKIEMPGLDGPAYVLAVPGNDKTVAVAGKPWRFQVQSTDVEWPILSEEDKGKKAYAVNVAVQPPEGEPFVRQLLADFPQYTEDVLPGKGRAIKSLGRKLVDEQLSLSLDFEPTEYFHIMDSWALYVRRVGEKDWIERPIRGLPRYHDRIGSRELVFTEEGDTTPLRTIDLPVPADPSAKDALGDTSVQVTSYLRYAQMQRRFSDGGERVNPVVQLSMLSPGAEKQKFELAALDPSHNTAVEGNLRFVWLADSSKVEALPTDSRALVTIRVPEQNVSLEVPLTAKTFSMPMTAMEGTPYSYRITDTHDGLSIPGKDVPLSIAVVEVQTPEGTFKRWVADSPEHTRDLHDAAADPHAVDARRTDPRFEMTYQPGSAPLLFAAHPGGLYFAFNGANGRAISREAKVGDVIEVVPGVSIRVDGYYANAVSDVRPYVVPPPSRERNAEETFAMIRVEIGSGSNTQSRWLNFNAYAFEDEQYAYNGRFAYSPERFKTADGVVEVLFSRERMKLPTAIALQDFELDTHLGGYSGSVSTIRNYVSRLRFLDKGQWTEPRVIAVNDPTDFGGFWYFQSMWDRPSPGEPRGGMNYTGLGVGNRHGVYVQLAGCCLMVVGMCYAFYVKPVLKRRRAEQSRAKVHASEKWDEAETSPVADVALR